MRILRRISIRRDRRGVATIEFALLTCFVFAILLAALDFGMFFIQRSNLGAGVASAAVYGFSNASTVPYASLPAMVSAVAGAPVASDVTVTIECNDGSTPCVNQSRQCACLTDAGGFRATATCGEACTGSGTGAVSTSGYYLKVKATYQYRPTVVPPDVFGDTTLQQSAVVRLQ